MKKFIHIFGIVIINIFVFGALFKVQHWPGAGVLITMGLGIFSLVFLPLAFYQSYKGKGGKYKSLYISGLICAAITFIGAMFKIQHWPGAGYFLLVGIPLPFLYFLPLYVYHHNKSKVKSTLNFLGVMFMMVYIALFTSILALNVSYDVLFALSSSSEDISKTSELFKAKNTILYEDLQKADKNQNKEKIHQLKSKTEDICTLINNIKTELIKTIDGEDSQAITPNQTFNLKEVMAKNESGKTTLIMRGVDGLTGRGVYLRKELSAYRDYLQTLVENDTLKAGIIGELLTTSDIEDARYGEMETFKWEDDFFPYGTFMISILGNLDCIALDIKLAEGEVLDYLMN